MEAQVIPFCRTCGLAVNETDRFCGRCGTPIEGEAFYANGLWRINVFGKRSTNLANGFFIGIGASTVVAGLILLSWANSMIWTQRDIFLAHEISSNETNYFSLSYVGLASFSAIAVLVGSYILIIAALSQFSPRVNSLLHAQRINRTRQGLALLSGGMCLIASFIVSYAFFVYAGSSLTFWDQLSAIAGAILMVSGSVLFINDYLRSRGSATKFKEQNQPHTKQQ